MSTGLFRVEQKTENSYYPHRRNLFILVPPIEQSRTTARRVWRWHRPTRLPAIAWAMANLLSNLMEVTSHIERRLDIEADQCEAVSKPDAWQSEIQKDPATTDLPTYILTSRRKVCIRYAPARYRRFEPLIPAVLGLTNNARSCCWLLYALGHPKRLEPAPQAGASADGTSIQRAGDRQMRTN